MFKGLMKRLKKPEEPVYIIRVKDIKGRKVVESVYNRRTREAWSDETIAKCGLSVLNDKFDYLSDLLWKMLDVDDNIDEEHLDREIHSSGTVMVYLWYEPERKEAWS